MPCEDKSTDDVAITQKQNFKVLPLKQTRVYLKGS